MFMAITVINRWIPDPPLSARKAPCHQKALSQGPQTGGPFGSFWLGEHQEGDSEVIESGAAVVSTSCKCMVLLSKRLKTCKKT